MAFGSSLSPPSSDVTVPAPGMGLLGPGWSSVRAKEGRWRYKSAKHGDFESLLGALRASGCLGDGESFLTSGHPWIGARVTRVFNGKSLEGAITGWMPPLGADAALWRVRHDDGDSEDLEQSEAEEALEEHLLRPGSRVEARFEGKWYAGALRKVTRSKRTPFGVKCDADRGNSFLLWVPRRDVRLPKMALGGAPQAARTCINDGSSFNRALGPCDAKGSLKRAAETDAKATPTLKEPAQPCRRRPKQQAAAAAAVVTPRRTAAPSAANLISWTKFRQMHPTRMVTAAEWRKFVRGQHPYLKPQKSPRLPLSPATPARSPMLLSSSPDGLDSGATTPMQSPASFSAAASSPQPPLSSGRARRARKKRINPDFLWGKETRNPKQAIAAQQEGEHYASIMAETARIAAGGAPVDLNSNKCGICQGKGELLCCDGPCLRSFHTACLRVKEKDLPDGDWFCVDCRSGRPPKPYPARLPSGRKRSIRAETTPTAAPLGPAAKRARSAGKLSTKEVLKERLRQLRGFLSGGGKSTPAKKASAAKPKATKRKPSPAARGTPLNPPLRPKTTSTRRRSPSVPKTPLYLPVAPPVSGEVTVSSPSLEPWQQCVQCKTGRRSMTCARSMCALCCRTAGACHTHARFRVGDTLKVYKGVQQGKQGIMLAKKGHIISLRVENASQSTAEPGAAANQAQSAPSQPPSASAPVQPMRVVLYLAEETLGLVKQGPAHAAAAAAKRAGAATTRPRCIRCKRMFRNQSALIAHQRSCLLPVPFGAPVITPYGTGTVAAPRRADGILTVQLRFARAYLRFEKCIPAKTAKKRQRGGATAKSRRGATARPPPRVVGIAAAPRAKRQKSLPERFKKAKLKPVLASCYDLLDFLRRHKYGGVFSQPVPKSVAGYYETIQNPMDFSTIETRMLEVPEYSLDDFDADVRLVWSNAMKFNPPKHPVHDMAAFLSEIYTDRITRMRQRQEQERAREEARKARAAAGKAAAGGGFMTMPVRNRRKRSPASTGATSGASPKLDDAFRVISERMDQLRRQLGGMAGAGPRRAAPRRAPRRPTQRPISIRERQQLKTQIMALPEHRLVGVADIVRDATPGDDGGHVEIDLEALDNGTLRKLQAYVRRFAHEARAEVEQRENASEESSSSDEDSELGF